MAGKNKAAHGQLLEVLGDYRRRYKEHGFTAEVGRELVNTLNEWLSGHICSIDVHLKDCEES